ncbi:SDR family oxidoreductase [Cellulomonas sp. APG4]|uniref:SDR family NAD(P)-dependent oxidoreductase n=1 Tax=Cellulomonas sp. APG4 TaxID=1538656 RepID=UPI00137B3FAB|nr:SDR family oxidoreductase [Cellulomonas sp. APG4]
MKVAQKVLVVTGGGNGIGREVVLALLARGARVAAVDLSEPGLEATRERAEADERLSTHVVDVTQRAQVEALREEVLARHGQVDGVVNVAGIIQRFVRVADLDVAEMRKVFEVNLWGTVHVTTTFLPDLLTRPTACVVNVSSMGALAPVPGQSAYGASKAAVTLFTEGLYAELIDTTVDVTVVFPGGVSTDIAKNSGADLTRTATEPGAASMAMTTPADAARQLVDGLERAAFRVVIGKDARGLDRLSRLSPRRATELIARRMRTLLG